jgi:predicted metalloprotease with PDZ domain
MSSPAHNYKITPQASRHVKEHEEITMTTSPGESDVVLIASDAVMSNIPPRTRDVPEVTVTAVAAEEDDIPLATMELVPQESCQESSIERRPAIVCVTVLKSKERNRIVGILLRAADDVLRIVEIKRGGLFDETPIKVGDHVLSVNNISCEQMNVTHVSRLIQRAKQSVTVVVHRPDGDPYLVSTTITKPEPACRVGVGVQIYNGSLRISSIDPSGLFAGSILKIGDKVVSICDISCGCMDANAAIELIRQEEQAVTIVTWTEAEAGVVVAATKAIPFITRYKMFLPCLFSILLLTIISLIVALTNRDSHSSSDEEDRPCRNLYGQPIPYC